ncbi:MAG: hypothetical protein GY703_12585 [Gammaproteobacteria bacterium]|nr:hypothetical protein [Gammaproteobacteria bacterium]
MWRILGRLFLIDAVGLALWLGRSLDVTAVVTRVEVFGPLAWLVFMVIYALTTVLFLPGSVLIQVGGSLFGSMLGTLVNLTGASIGATLAFLLSRYLASDWVEQKTGGLLKQLKDGVEGEGRRFVAFVRLVPLFPFNPHNILLEELKPRISEFSACIEKPVALICTTDRRSMKAAQILGREGFADDHVVTGGMTQWNQEGRSIEMS